VPNHARQDPHCTYWTDGDPDVPVFQHPAEMEWLLALFRERNPRRILEVGSYFGGTLKQWIRHAEPGAVVVSVDLYNLPYADNRARYAGWGAAAGVEVHAIAGNSYDPVTVAAAAQFGPFDWIMIDGDHRDRAVRGDWAAYRQLAAPNGVVLFHDILDNRQAHPEIQVAPVWAEIKRQYRTAELIAGNGKWGGVGAVFMGQRL
jgi:predicted O-methyltransferase YrrM